LGLSDFNALKLVCYGDFEEILPWLVRRLHENSDVLGATVQERVLLWREVKRRMTFSNDQKKGN